MAEKNRKIRVLLAKPGLDGHDRGIKILAQGLKEAGMEVIYTGLHQQAPQIVSAAIQEDVDIIGLSILSGVHMTLAPDLVNLLKELGAADKAVVVGGFIPEEEDRRALEALGVKKVFDQDTPLKEIVAFMAGINLASNRK
ncbi:MAG: cobalamin B12-binding domain-containing protein [Thermodesulfobacteriota bacterium]